MTENVFINTKNRSHTITAEVTIPKGGANGVILSQAGRFGGWSLYLKDGKPMYTYNYLGLSASKWLSEQRCPAARRRSATSSPTTEDGLGKGGIGNDLRQRRESRRRADRPHAALLFSADEGADVGVDETPVTEDYKGRQVHRQDRQGHDRAEGRETAAHDEAEQAREVAALRGTGRRAGGERFPEARKRSAAPAWPERRGGSAPQTLTCASRSIRSTPAPG